MCTPAPPHNSLFIIFSWLIRFRNDARFVGVADIASVRFSLPANLLEPIPNLGRQLVPYVRLVYSL